MSAKILSFVIKRAITQMAAITARVMMGIGSQMMADLVKT